MEEVPALSFLDNCSCLVTRLESKYYTLLSISLLSILQTSYLQTQLKCSLQCISSKRLFSSPLLPPPSQTPALPPLPAVHPGLLELAARELAFVEIRTFERSVDSNHTNKYRTAHTIAAPGVCLARVSPLFNEQPPYVQTAAPAPSLHLSTLEFQQCMRSVCLTTNASSLTKSRISLLLASRTARTLIPWSMTLLLAHKSRCPLNPMHSAPLESFWHLVPIYSSAATLLYLP